MSIAYFEEDGIWERPEGAVAIDILVIAGGGGGSRNAGGLSGEAALKRLTTPDIPETLDVAVGKGGRGVDGGQDGADGAVWIVTYLEDEVQIAPYWMERFRT